MKNPKKYLIILLIIFSLFSCSKQEKHPSNWLIRALYGDPTSLNPLIATDTAAKSVNSFIYEKLIDIDQNLDFIPRLAKKWEISQDRLQYIFHLRTDVNWHDGTPFTAEDVVFTFENISNPETGSILRYSDFEFVERVYAANDSTIIAQYSRPFAPALSTWDIFIVPRHIFKKEKIRQSKYNRTPVGTGPYKFVQWNTNQQIIIEKNKNYWGINSNIEKIIFKIIPDNSVALRALQTGQVDAIDLTTVQWARETQDDNFLQQYSKIKYYPFNYSYIAWNSQHSPFFKDKRVRIAMTKALDRKQIRDEILFGLYEISTGSFGLGTWAYDNTINPYAYNLQEAGQLLEDAGWQDNDGDGIREKDGVPFKFTLQVSSNNSITRQIAQILQLNLRKIGVEASIKSLEWAVFLNNVHKGNFQAAALARNTGIDPDCYSTWHSSQIEGGGNYSGFSSAKMDSLLEQGRMTFNIDERQKIYHQIHGILHEEQPFTFLFARSSLMAIDKRFLNVIATPLGIYNFYPGLLSWEIAQE